jgi:asparagine synthase (glutamine-hydrolysing)
MCGIAGCLELGTCAEPDAQDLLPVIDALSHRGPDSTGVFHEGPVGLAHSRLSIIDLAGGQQPIANEDGTVQVVFNGEIFNYLELRAELLARGHRFRTLSDTEVIVHLYEERQENFVDALNGQFAIAIWDARRRALVLARDRVGIRPIFWTKVGSRFWFASEIKALMRVPGTRRRLTARGLAEVLTFWSPAEETAWFEGMKPLAPGSVMTVKAGDTAEPRAVRYWDWPFVAEPDLDPRPIEQCAEELEALLIDAVRLQMRADVPVGAYLSGGLDSSLVTALARRHTDTEINTFSIGFDDPELDESEYQDIMARTLGTRHARVRCTARDIALAFPRAIWHAEVPLVRTAPTPLMLLSRLVRDNGLKVVLTGEGSDEVFAGYDIFKEARVRRFWARRPGSTLRPKILARLYPYLATSPTSVPAFARGFFSQGLDKIDSPLFSHLPRWATTRRAWRFFSAGLRDALADFDPQQHIEASLPAAAASWPPLARDQYLEAHTLLSTYLLSSQGDRMAMASSVEARFPYLDHRVVELAARLPPSFKLFGLREKYILKRAFSQQVPETIRRRPKQPYRAPDSRAFFEEGRPLGYVAELLSPSSLADAGYFDPVSTGLLVAKCARGEAVGFADNQAFVAILSTMLVHHMFVRNLGPLEVAPC